MATATRTAVTRATPVSSRSTSLPTIADLDRALERPIQRVWDHDLEVLGCHRRRDGTKIYCVNSFSRPGTFHDVTKRRGSMELVCDCEAYTYGKRPCSHCVCAWCAMVVEASRRETAVRKIGAKLAAEIRPSQASSMPAHVDEFERLEREASSAFGPPSPDCPQLADDGRGFSLYK
jgi:hypothetical protein